MQIPLETLNSYKEKFKLANPNIRFYQEDKTWYKQKFQFKLNFRRSNEFWRSKDEHALNQWYIKTFGPARFRTEAYNTVFTNSTDFLDFVLNNKDTLASIAEFYTSSDQYLTELEQIGNIAVDIKLIGKKSYVPEYKYEIEFNEWKLYDTHTNPINYADRRVNALKEIIEFCKTNKDDVEALPHLVSWYNHYKKENKKHVSTWGYSPYYYGRVSIYVKNEDIILQIVMLYQEKIKKIYKLIERVKNES